MRKLGADALAMAALTAVTVAAGSGAGCSTTKPTELVPGVSSQVVVPHDLQAVRLTVTANGVPKFDGCYQVGANGINGAVQLPSTLGLVSGGSSSTVVKITVTGYDTPSDDCENAGSAAVGSPGGPHILRRSTQTYVDGHTLFVPMPLTYSCWNTACGDPNDPTNTMACQGNTCVDTNVAVSELVEYDPSLVDGTGNCFSPAECFGDKPEGGGGGALSFAPELVNPNDCTYAFPTGLAPQSLNVRAYYQTFNWVQGAGGQYQSVFESGGEQEILNQSPTEGFTFVDPATLALPDAGVGDAATPDGGAFAGDTLFRLAPGLCQLVHAQTTPPPSPPGGSSTYITISDLRVSNICPAKTPLLPICAGEQTNGPALPDGQTTTNGVCGVGVSLAPTQSALYLVMDQSAVMHGAFGPDGSATALNLSLSDPVFKRTFAAFKFLPGSLGDCTSPMTSFLTPDIDFGLASDVQSQIAMKLSGWTPPMSEVTGGACATSADCPALTPVCANSTCIAPNALALQAAARSDQGTYKHITDFLNGKEPPNLAATMFFVNRIPDLTNDCSPPLNGQATVQAALENEILAAYNATPSLQTYFVVLDDDAHDVTAPTGALAFYQQIQADLPQAVTTLDGTPLDITTSAAPTQMQEDAANTAAANFSNLVAQLGTCVYDYTPPASIGADAGVDPTTLEVAYTLPSATGAPTRLVVPYASSCTAAAQSTVDGWNFDSGRIRICGNPCSTLRQGILAASAVAANNKLPAPDVPVTAAILCAGATVDASASGGSISGPPGSNGSSGGGSSGTQNTDGSISPIERGDSGSPVSLGGGDDASEPVPPVIDAGTLPVFDASIATLDATVL
jgi:hypothetical protein